jgi:hypothetical protein
MFRIYWNIYLERQLIHLIDVQKSVGLGADLEKVGKHPSDERRRQKDEGELEEEQDKEEEERALRMSSTTPS